MKLLDHYLFHTREIFLCIYIDDMYSAGTLTKGETVFLAGRIEEELKHSGKTCLHSVIERKKVKHWFFFERLETMRELRIRWLQEQIAKFNV